MMTDEGSQGRIERLLELARAALTKSDTGLAEDIAEAVLAIDPSNSGARELKLSLVQSIVRRFGAPSAGEPLQAVAAAPRYEPETEPLKFCIATVYLKSVASTNLDELGDTGWTIKTDLIDPKTGQPSGKEKTQTHDFDRSTDRDTGKRSWQFPILRTDSRLADPMVTIGCGNLEIRVKVTVLHEGRPEEKTEKEFVLKYACGKDEHEENPRDNLVVTHPIGRLVIRTSMLR